MVTYVLKDKVDTIKFLFADVLIFNHILSCTWAYNLKITDCSYYRKINFFDKAPNT